MGTVKTLASLDEESARGDLKRHLGAWDLTALGIGDIIGMLMSVRTRACTCALLISALSKF